MLSADPVAWYFTQSGELRACIVTTVRAGTGPAAVTVTDLETGQVVNVPPWDVFPERPE
jgi:hypothetical protein